MSPPASAFAAATVEVTVASRAAATVAVLRLALSRFERVAYSNSLGAEAMVLTDLICRQVPSIDIFTVDTGRLPEPTLALLERLEQRYARRIALYHPAAEAVEEWVRVNGINGFYNGLEQRQGCCHVRKVEPFRRALSGYRAWVTGVRRDQSPQRANAVVIEERDSYGLAKVSPLLEWSEAEIWHYIRANDLPYNPLHDHSFTSIGCAPCTRAVEVGQDPRAGRWWWEHPESRECGLHPRARPGSALEI